MAKPKCKYCGAEIDKKVAYKINVDNKNMYFCNQDEYVLSQKAKEEKEKQLELKNKCFNLISEIFGDENITNTAFFSELQKLYGNYALDDIYTYLSCNFNYLSQMMSVKYFQTYYAKIRYFFVVLNNELSEFIFQNGKQDYMKLVETEIIEGQYKRKLRKKSIEEYEAELSE